MTQIETSKYQNQHFQKITQESQLLHPPMKYGTKWKSLKIKKYVSSKK